MLGSLRREFLGCVETQDVEFQAAQNINAQNSSERSLT